jgi:hypothetical protein
MHEDEIQQHQGNSHHSKRTRSEEDNTSSNLAIIVVTPSTHQLTSSIISSNNALLLDNGPLLENSSTANSPPNSDYNTKYSTIATEIRTSIDFWLKNLILKKMVKARNEFLKKKETVKKLEEHKSDGSFPLDFPQFTGYNQYPLSLPEDRRAFYREREKQSCLTFKLLTLDIRLEGHIEDRENAFETFNNLRSTEWIIEQAKKIWPMIHESPLMKTYIQEGATFLIDHVTKNSAKFPCTTNSIPTNHPSTPFDKRFARLDVNDHHTFDDDMHSVKSHNSSKSHQSGNRQSSTHNNHNNNHNSRPPFHSNHNFQRQPHQNNNYYPQQPPPPPPPPQQQQQQYYNMNNNNNYHHQNHHQQQENNDYHNNRLNSFGRGRGFIVQQHHQRTDNFHRNRERSQSRSNRRSSSNYSPHRNQAHPQPPAHTGPRVVNQNFHQNYSNNQSSFHPGGDQPFVNQGRGNHGHWKN